MRKRRDKEGGERKGALHWRVITRNVSPLFHEMLEIRAQLAAEGAQTTSSS